jgi:uncharacterized protein (TIGR02217 family)
MVDNVRLPVHVERESEGGPRFMTDVQVSMTGKEQRISQWDAARCEYDISYGITSRSDVEAVLALFRSRRGQAYPFRFKDWNDYTVDDETIGEGDASDATFQIIKTYYDGVLTHTRTIQLPVSGTLTVRVGTVSQVEGVDYNVNYSTGIITFTGGSIPGLGDDIIVSCEFDVPVRFADDYLTLRMLDDSFATVPGIKIVEVLDE